MKFRPLYDRIAVQQDENPSTSAGGLVLLNEDAPLHGTVIAIGSGAYDKDGKIQPLQVQVGDKIAFPKHVASQMIDVDGEQAIIMFEKEILTILVNE